MAKRPSFQFYTGDWKKDPELSLCSPSTRGIWIDLMCAIHDLDRPDGSIEGAPATLSQVCRCTKKQMNAAISELGKTGTATIKFGGGGVVSITCRRMARDWEERSKDRIRKNSGKIPPERERKTTKIPDQFQENSARSSSSASSSPSPSGKQDALPAPQGGADGQGDSQDELPGIEREMPPDEIKRRWNALADQAGLPKLKSVRGERLANYRRREAEYPTLWDDSEGHDLQTQIPLLNDNARGLTADWNGITFDWLVKNELNIQKACEGHYKNRALEKRRPTGKSALDKMIELRSGTADDVEKYHRRLTMYRTQKDSWGKLKPNAAEILKALGESNE